jgi:hypothetical protein
MLKGIHLTLMIGPMVPVPVPQTVLDALDTVKVITTSGEGTSGFELNFTLSNRSPLHTLFLVSGGAAIPIMRVIIVATANGLPQVLMDGMMTHHQVTPGSEPGQSTLTVKGQDLSALMDYLPLDGVPYPAMPPAARVLSILSRYASFGIAPMVIPSVLEDIPLPINHIPGQKDTDLTYIQQLAKETGYVFYIDPGPLPGSNIAYWGPEIKVGVPQPALNVNMDAHTNVESLSFSFDPQAKEVPVVFIHNQATKLPVLIPIPNINPLSPPLGLVPPLLPKIAFLIDSAKLSPLRAVLYGLAYASQHSDVVSGTGSLDVQRYGRILKARQLVGVRGAGAAFDGLYYVKSVTHNIKRGQYTQDFTLSRNGLLSTLPKVPA